MQPRLAMKWRKRDRLSRRMMRSLKIVSYVQLDCVWNVMAHAQKPDFVFRWNGRVHLNRRGRQFSRLLAAEVCASAVVMLDTPCSEVAWRVLVTHSIRQLPLHFPSRASPCAITFRMDSAVFRLTFEIPTPGILSLSCPVLSLVWAETRPERNEKIRILIDIN